MGFITKNDVIHDKTIKNDRKNQILQRLTVFSLITKKGENIK